MTRLLDLGQPLVIAHRGASAERPENTLPAFARALELGADALELDVRLAGDGAAVVMHDSTVDRTTGASGRLASFSAGELAQLGVPSLAEVLAAFPAAELLVEIKEPVAGPAIRAEITAAGAEERCVVAAEAAAALVGFRGGKIAICGARPDIVELRWRSALGLVARAGAYRTLSIPVSYRGIPVATRTFFRSAAAAGMPVHVWTVDNPVQARALWAAGATGIVTNDVAKMVAAREATTA